MHGGDETRLAANPGRCESRDTGRCVHWLADAGWDMPATYADVFGALAQHDVIPPELATRLSAAAAFRNLVAHQYGVLDWRRVYALAGSDLGDLDVFCATLAGRARDQQ